MEGRASISPEILASYAGDAAREVAGVRGRVESHLPRHKGVRIADENGRVRVELHLALDWGVSVPDVGRFLGALPLRRINAESVTWPL